MAAGAARQEDRGVMRDEFLTPLPVLIAGLPPMTGDLIGALLERDPLAEVHQHGGAGEDLVVEVDRLGIRVLIVGAERLEEAHAAASSRPMLKVLVVAADGGDSELHEFVPVRRRLGEISADTLERTMRDAAVSWPPWERV